jgi:nitroreductase
MRPKGAPETFEGNRLVLGKRRLAAKAMGYDSCPMIGFDPVKGAEIISLPSDHVIGFMIAVGKAVKPATPKGGQLALSEVMMQDRFA